MICLENFRKLLRLFNFSIIFNNVNVFNNYIQNTLKYKFELM